MISAPFTLTAVIGAIVLQERTLRQMSQADLAAAAKLHPVALSRIERGQQGDIGIETLGRLAEGLSSSGRPVTAATLLTRAEEYRRRLLAGVARGILPVAPSANATAAAAAGLVTGAALVALIAFLASDNDERVAPPPKKTK